MAPKTDVIEQLRERVRELEEFKANVVKECASIIKHAHKDIAKQLAAAQEEIERLNQQSANRLIGLCKCGEDNDELRAQLSAAQEEIERYKASPTVETCRQMIESQAVKENKILFDQLAKAEQLWQLAQGRCDGLEEKLAKAEQRVAEAISAMCNKSIAPWEQRRHGRTEAEDKVIEIIEGIEAGEWRKFVKEV